MNPVMGRIYFTLGTAGLLVSSVALLAGVSEGGRTVSLLLLFLSLALIATVVILVRREARECYAPEGGQRL